MNMTIWKEEKLFVEFGGVTGSVVIHYTENGVEVSVHGEDDEQWSRAGDLEKVQHSDPTSPNKRDDYLVVARQKW